MTSRKTKFNDRDKVTNVSREKLDNSHESDQMDNTTNHFEKLKRKCGNLECYCHRVGFIVLQNEETELIYQEQKSQRKIDEETKLLLIHHQLRKNKIPETLLSCEVTNNQKKWKCGKCSNQYHSPEQVRNCLFKHFGIKWSSTQMSDVIYDLGNGVIVFTADEAMDKFFRREFVDVLEFQQRGHKFFCVPDSFEYGPIAAKVVFHKTERKEKFDGDDACVIGKIVEEKLFNKFRYEFERQNVTNTVMISGLQIKQTGKNDKSEEFDILILCNNSKTIIQIESKRSFHKEGNAFDQLDLGFKHFNSKLPFPAKNGWHYVKVAYFEKDWEPKLTCDAGEPFIITPSTDIGEWLKTMKIPNEVKEINETDPNYLNALKYMFYIMYQNAACITNNDLLQLTEKNIDIISSPQKILFLNKVQHKLLSGNDQKKRVAFLSQFGTGKTTLLKAKARELLKKHIKILFIVFKDPELKGDSLLFQSYKEEFKTYEPKVQFCQLSSAGSSVEANLLAIVKDHSDFHLFLEEVPVCRNGISTLTLKKLSEEFPKDNYLWLACQSEHAPNKKLLEGNFFCPEMSHPLRYAGNLLKLAKAIKDCRGRTCFPTKDVNPDLYLNRGPRTIFFSLKRETNLSCAMDQLAYILNLEREKTLIKIDFEPNAIITELKNSVLKERLLILEDPGITPQDILNIYTKDKLLVIGSKDNGFIRGFEFPIVVHFSPNIEGDQVEAIYSRCKSKLIIVCHKELSELVVKTNAQCDFAKVLEVNDMLMPQNFESAIRNKNLEEALQYLDDQKTPLPIDVRNKASQTGLMIACLVGSEDLVEEFLLREANLDTVDYQFWTPIHFASMGGNVNVVKKVVLDSKEKLSKEDFEKIVKATTNNGAMAIHLAATIGNAQVVNCLVTEGLLAVDEKTNDNLGLTAFHIACKNNHLETAKKLIKLEANTHIQNKQRESAIHLAAASGSSQVVKYLIENSIFNINEKTNNKNKYTPLHLAIVNGHLDTIKLLLEQKADSQIETSEGKKAIHLAAEMGNTQIVKHLIKNKFSSVNEKVNNETEETPLLVACRNNCLETVKWLLKKNADTKMKTKQGDKGIHLAAANGSTDVVKYLITKKIFKMNETNNVFRYTPIHLACKNDHLETVKCLLKLGAKPKLDRSPQEMIHLAAKHGSTKVVEYFLKEKLFDVDVKMRCTFEESSLHLAAQNGHLETVKTLVKNNANPTIESRLACKLPIHLSHQNGHVQTSEFLANLKNKDGETALHVTIKKDDLKFVKILVMECGAHANIQNNNGQTPLHLASEKGYLDVVMFLVYEAKADVNIKDVNGQSTLHLASAQGYLDVVRVLVNEAQADVQLKDDHGQTPLHLASEKGHENIVNFLKEHI